MTLRELADRLGCRLEGDGGIEITRVATLEAAGPGDVTFFANPRYAHALQTTRASAVILGDDAPAAPAAMLRSPHPYQSFAQALETLNPEPAPPPGVHPTALVGESVDLGEGISLGPYVVVGDGARIGHRVIVRAHSVIGAGAQIGDDSILHARVSIRERCTLGRRVVVQDGAVIGSDGYGFVTDAH